MNFGWESEEERLKRYMKIPPSKKMEWLFEMYQMVKKTSNKNLRKIRRELRNMR